MALNPMTLIQSPPSFQSAASALGGTAAVESDNKLSTGTFNFGGSSLNSLFFVGAAVAAFFIWRKFK